MSSNILPGDELARPVWLLDVDGVLNATALAPSRRTFAGWARDSWVQRTVELDGISFVVTIAQPVIDLVNQAHESGKVEIRWHTMWQSDANRLSKLFGLPELPVQATDSTIGHHVHWKTRAALEVAQTRRILWTDDDAPKVLQLDRSHLVVRPEPACGLSTCDVERIRAWLDL